MASAVVYMRFSNTSLVMAVKIAATCMSSIDLFMHDDLFYSLCFCFELVHGMQSAEAVQGYSSYPPYLNVRVLHCWVYHTHITCVRVCVACVNDRQCACV